VLLKYNTNINAKCEGGLHAVIEGSGNLDVVRMLLEHNVNVDAKSKWGNTPLHIAVRMRKLNIARMLIEHNANVNSKDKWGHMAAMGEGKSGITRMLIEHNANVECPDLYSSNLRTQRRSWVGPHSIWLYKLGLMNLWCCYESIMPSEHGKCDGMPCSCVCTRVRGRQGVGTREQALRV
jgi:ankyrin repeat protein